MNTKQLTKTTVASGSFDSTDKLLYLDDTAGIKGVAASEAIRTALLDGKQPSQIGELMTIGKTLSSSSMEIGHWYRIAHCFNNNNYAGVPGLLMMGTSYTGAPTSSAIIALHKGGNSVDYPGTIEVLSATSRFSSTIEKMRLAYDEDCKNCYLDVLVKKKNLFYWGIAFGWDSLAAADVTNATDNVRFELTL